MSRIFTYLLADLPDQPHKVILWDTIDITVGRGSDQDIVVNDSEVSRKHAEFRLDGQRFTVADLHTSNGTFVNGAQIATHELRPGDSVEIGGATFTFRREEDSPMGKGVETCFASQLKGFAPELEAAGGRTVLGMAPSEAAGGFEPGDDLADLGPVGELQLDLEGDPVAVPAPAAEDPLSADMTRGGVQLEALELDGFEEDEALDMGKEEPPSAEPVVEAFPTNPPEPPPAPRRAAAAVPPAPPAQARTQPRTQAVPPQRAAAPSPAPAPQPPREDRVAASVSLEIEGPRETVRALLATLLDRELELPPLRLRVRRPQD